MLIKTDDRKPYVHCKVCETTFQMGSSCECKSVRTQDINSGATLIIEDGDSAIIDTE